MASGIGEATGEDTDDLTRIRSGKYFNSGDPFNPFKVATIWSD
jgi:hypothetical protein